MTRSRRAIFCPLSEPLAICRHLKAGLLGIGVVAVLSIAPALLHTQEQAPAPLPEMHWRMIGPFRGGRTDVYKRQPEYLAAPEVPSRH